MIRSTFAGFTTAQLAMSASQRALDVTGQNIANINTDGYTRQRLDLVSLNYVNGNYMTTRNTGNIGFGVLVTGNSQIRDPLLDKQYRNQITKVGTTDAQLAALEQIEGIFDETDKEGLRLALSEISKALSELSSNVGNETFDSIVRSRFQVLLNKIHSKGNDLEDARVDTTDALQNVDIPKVNDILKEISDLNTSIWNSQVLGNPALELQDQRNLKLDELATYLPIKVNYKDFQIGDGRKLSYMEMTFTDSTGTSHKLISGEQGKDSAQLSSTVDANGKVSIGLLPSDAVAGTAPTDITDKLVNGVLKGTLDILNKSGGFDTPPSDVKGFGYYKQAFDSFVDTLATTFNNLNKKPGGGIDALFVTSDGSSKFTASNIKISDDWMNNTIRINPTDEVDGGSTANKNIMDMINALDSNKASHEFKGNNGFVFYKGGFDSCYANIESVLAIDMSSSSSILKNHVSVLTEIANNRDNVSGVQLDEEGINLMQYQRSYTAAARLMTTLDEALDVLINRTGVVGR